jgi:hypothetical protein
MTIPAVTRPTQPRSARDVRALASAPRLPHNVAMPHHLAILGAGNMAEAIARGVLRSKLLAPGQVTASDPSPQRRELFATEL